MAGAGGMETKAQGWAYSLCEFKGRWEGLSTKGEVEKSAGGLCVLAVWVGGVTQQEGRCGEMETRAHFLHKSITRWVPPAIAGAYFYDSSGGQHPY